MGDFHQAPFDMPRVLVTAEGEVWQTTENFHGSADSTLSENINESYMTADGDGDNTQYFSVLETSSETILNDMSGITLDGTREVEEYVLHEAEETVAAPAEDQQLVLFQMEGSDEYYGVQVAEDADGNLQKYQFQLRQTEDGQYETVPGSIQIVPMDSDAIIAVKETVEPVVVEPSQIAEQTSHAIYVKQEYFEEAAENQEIVQKEDEQLMEEAEQQEEEEFIEEELHIHVTGDTKEGIIEKALQRAHSSVYETRYIVEEPDNSETHNEATEEAASAVTEFLTTKASGNMKKELVTYEQLYFNESEDEEAENCDVNEHCEIEEVLIEEEDHDDIHAGVDMYFSESPGSAESMGFIEEEDDELDDEEEWGSDDAEESLMPIGTHHQQFNLNASNRMEMVTQLVDHLNGSALKLNNKNNKTKENYLSILVSDTEKENLPKKTTPKLMNSKITPEKPVEIEKRFQRGKDAVQARKLHNFISQTTILQAPVRQERLPRKQKINPVVRADEDIVVQEVKVSNGFIEISEDGVLRERKQLVPLECIQLSDSDEGGVRGKKRKRKTKKQVEIVISDSEGEESPPSVADVRKEEINCTKCTKTFPSIGSLRTHMQFHVYEDANKTKTALLKHLSSAPYNTELLQNNTEVLQNITEVLQNNTAVSQYNTGPSQHTAVTTEITTAATEYNSVLLQYSTALSEHKTVLAQHNTSPSPQNAAPIRHNVTPTQLNTAPLQFTIEPMQLNTVPLIVSTVPSNISMSSQLIATPVEVSSSPTEVNTSPSVHNAGSLICNIVQSQHKSAPPQLTSTAPQDNNRLTQRKKVQSLYNPAQLPKQKENSKYKCDICGDTFKNSILLKRHVDSHKTAKFVCTLCKRIFSDKTQLATHKRSHVKEHMFQTTTPAIISPKKQTFKRPAPVQNKLDAYKCSVCPRSFATALLLSSHSKSHKRLMCPNCPATFTSRLLLDDHRLRNCVKSPGLKKRTSFVPPKKTVTQPSKRLTIQPTQKPKTPLPSALQINCDECHATLPSYKKLLEHRVNVHGYRTPDSTVGKTNHRKSLYRPCGAHSGVPASLKVQKAFAAFRMKLEDLQQ